MQGSKGDTDVKNRFLDTVGEGEGGIIWENSIEIYTLPHVKSIVNGSMLFDTGNPNPVLWNNPEGRIGKEGGRGVQDEGDMCIPPCGRLMLMYGKSHHNMVIILQLK